MVKDSFNSAAVMENYSDMIRFVEDCAKEYAGKDEKNNILLAAEEILVNIISYSYAGTEGDVDIKFLYDEDTREIKFIFSNSGIKFNPLEHDPPDLGKDIMEREIGGLGIMFVIRLMDKVEYAYEDSKNILTLTKVIG